MAYPSKPDGEGRKTFGLSMPMPLAERIDALRGDRDRSPFLAELIEEGLDRRYGPRWREMADGLLGQKEPVAA